MSKKLKIIYAPGPANFIGSYNHWKNGQDDPSRVAFPYSSQFFNLCCTLDADAYIISPCREKELLHDDRFIIEHRPRPLINASGILYYLSQFWYELNLIASAIGFGANVAVVADGQTPWFILSLLRWLVVEVPPDDIKGYGDAILRLCDDWEFYEQKRLACLGLQDKFYDISRGWGAILKAIFRSIEESKRVENVL